MNCSVNIDKTQFERLRNLKKEVERVLMVSSLNRSPNFYFSLQDEQIHLTYSLVS